MSEEQNILESKRFEIIEGLIVDHTKKCVVTPYKREIADKIQHLSYIKELYDNWETTNMGILAPVWQEGSNVKISLLAKGSNVKNRKTLDP